MLRLYQVLMISWRSKICLPLKLSHFFLFSNYLGVESETTRELNRKQVLDHNEIVNLVRRSMTSRARKRMGVPQQISMCSSPTDVGRPGVVENLVGIEELEEVDVAATVTTKQDRERGASFTRLTRTEPRTCSVTE